MTASEAIKDSYLFRGLSEDELNTVAELAQEKAYNGGDQVVRQFDKSSDILIILDGGVKIKGFHGEDLAELASGSVIGELSLIDDAPRSATALAVGNTRAALIPAGRLHTLLETDVHMKSAVMENLARLLCARLRGTNVQLDSALSSRGEE